MNRAGEQIRRMLEACGSIELVVGIDKVQPFQESTGRDILRVMPGEDRPGPAHRERMLDDTRGRFERIALSPVPRRDMHAKLRNVRDRKSTRLNSSHQIISYA